MSLAMLLYPPPEGQTGLQDWMWHNYMHHISIIGAISVQRQIRQDLLIIWPVSKASFTTWLEEHQQMHNQTNSVLETASYDLSSVDPNNKRQFDAWLWLHFTEHRNWATTLGVGA